MYNFCVKCGAPITTGSDFCGNCGVEIKNRNPDSLNTNHESKCFPVSLHKPVLIKWLSLIVIVVVVFWGVNYFAPKINASWAVDKAQAEVKREVYSKYDAVAQVSGELIYKDSPHYIVVVKYRVSSLDWEGSYACLVYGYREDNCFVSRMTTEMSYNYNYKANLDELKVLWALN